MTTTFLLRRLVTNPIVRKRGPWHEKTPVEEKYDSLRGPNGFLGPPTTEELPSPDGNGKLQHYTNGSIYWSTRTGAHEVHHAIRDRWMALGWEMGLLGYPTTDESQAVGDGRCNQFENGSIYWTPSTGAHEVQGDIRSLWAAMGWERSLLGYPTTDEIPIAKDGRVNHFQGGSIYWTKDTGAHEVHGAIRDRWAETGWEHGPLGYPTTDESQAVGDGRCNHFENGSIYWTPSTGANEVQGDIKSLWAAMGWERSLLGYPTTHEIPIAKNGRVNHFQGGSIYWTKDTGAHEVHGAIRDRWAETGWEHGPLGYPLTSEFRTFDLVEPDKRLRISAFENGFIAYSEADYQTHVILSSSYRGLTLVVTPIFWGREWNPVNPTWTGQGWVDVDNALNGVLSAGVTSGLQGYGIAAAIKARGTWRKNDDVPDHFQMSSEAIPRGFTQDELLQGVNDAIFQHGAPTPMHSKSFFEGLPALTTLMSVYLVFLPSGCYYRDEPGGAGCHLNCNFHDPQGRLRDVNDIKVCWIGQGSSSLSDTLTTALHELVEAADDAAGREIADRCQAGNGQNFDKAGFDDSVAGIRLRSYWSNFHNRCILPPLSDPSTGQLPLH